MFKMSVPKSMEPNTKRKLAAASCVGLIILLLAALFYKLSFLLQINDQQKLCDVNACINRILQGPPEPDNVYVSRFLKNNFIFPSRGGQVNLSGINERESDKHFTNANNFIGNYFKDQEKGKFLVLGAGDGEYKDLTLHLEQQKGWTGLLVEPVPQLFSLLKAKNRNAEVANLCVSPSSYPWKTDFTHPKVLSELSEDDKIKIYRQAAIHIFNRNMMTATERTKVQCVPLSTIVENSDIIQDTVDLLILDMSGVDSEILAALPSRNFPKIMHAMAIFKPNDTERMAATLLTDINMIEAARLDSTRSFFVRYKERADE